MANVRIIATPPGEAPEDVRRAWVGLSLPIAKGRSKRPKKYFGTGVISGPREFLPGLFAVLLGRCEKHEGYMVDAPASIEILAQSNPKAADWWRRETPHLLQPRRTLIFPTDVCELEL